MSSAVYGILTNERDTADPDKSQKEQPPGVKTFVDALAALVPAEVLALHATVISWTTDTTVATASAEASTRIIDRETLSLSFFGMLALSMIIYAIPRLTAKLWDSWDYLRVLIPPSAFVGWTMLQRMTAFDAVFPNLGSIPRSVGALFLAVVLGLVAGLLAYKADQKPSEPTDPDDPGNG